jgi:hypothetical protein
LLVMANGLPTRPGAVQVVLNHRESLAW